jgi:hypothetical protein
MTKHKYYRDGVEIGEAEALDRRGLLRDGCSCRVSATMRDGTVPPTLWADPFADAKVGFTDGSGNPWSASRPGFRIRANDDRKAQRDAVAAYNLEISSRWKCGDQQSVCQECSGSGSDGDSCDNCGGEGVVDDNYERSSAAAFRNSETNPYDRRTVDMAQHRQLMDKLYRERDAELEQAWRQKT